MILSDGNESKVLKLPDGGWLRYAMAGEGDPVVFIHGFGLDSSMWDRSSTNSCWNFCGAAPAAALID